MICPQNPEHGHMFDTPQGQYDYYCPNKHEPDEGLFVNEVLEGDTWVPKVARVIAVEQTPTSTKVSLKNREDGPIMIPETKRKRRAK